MGEPEPVWVDDKTIEFDKKKFGFTYEGSFITKVKDEAKRNGVLVGSRIININGEDVSVKANTFDTERFIKAAKKKQRNNPTVIVFRSLKKEYFESKMVFTAHMFKRIKSKVFKNFFNWKRRGKKEGERRGEKKGGWWKWGGALLGGLVSIVKAPITATTAWLGK